MIDHSRHDGFEPTGVYVEPHQLQQLRFLARPIPRSVNMARIQASSGRHRSLAISRGMEFEEVRLYQAGDDVRSIDWRVTARTQKPHTKQYRDEKEKPVVTLVDQRHSMFFGSQKCFKSVYACYLAALINWSTLQRGDRAGGLVIGSKKINESRPSRSHKSVNLWLQSLTKSNQSLNTSSLPNSDSSLPIQFHQEPHIADALKQLIRIARSGGEYVLITDGYDINSTCEELLFQLVRHNSVSLYWLVDPLEREIPRLTNLSISNGRDQSHISINQNLQQAFRQLYETKREYLQKICRRLTIHFVEVDIGERLTAMVYRASRKR